MLYACHCTICQRQSGSAFAMAVVFPGAEFTMKGTGVHPWNETGKRGTVLLVKED
jgi:hypothetical protein